jgi:hypothetical protein
MNAEKNAEKPSGGVYSFWAIGPSEIISVENDWAQERTSAGWSGLRTRVADFMWAEVGIWASLGKQVNF